MTAEERMTDFLDNALHTNREPEDEYEEGWFDCHEDIRQRWKEFLADDRRAALTITWEED